MQTAIRIRAHFVEKFQRRPITARQSAGQAEGDRVTNDRVTNRWIGLVPGLQRRLGNDPGLARFIDQVARRVEGRVVVPDLDGLGAAVVGDYLRSRRRR